MDPMQAIRATFFQECDELLGDLENGVLAMQDGGVDLEAVNAVFRAVHSIKGGAGAFGLDELVRFAHVFETTLDEVRSERLAATAELIGLMLRASDVLADHVAQAKGGAVVDPVASAAVASQLAQYVGGDHAGVEDEPEPDFGFTPMLVSLDADDGATDSGGDATNAWRVTFTPHARLYRNANDSLRLIRELRRLGEVEVRIDASALPDLGALDVDEAGLTFDVLMRGDDLDEAQLREVFDFVEGDCDLVIGRDTPEAGQVSVPTDADADQEAAIARLLSQLGQDAAPSPKPEPDVVPPALAPVAIVATPATTAAVATNPSAASPVAETPAPATIRVDLERVDRLIDLVGELVINQAMLAQRVHEAGLARNGAVAVGLDDLEQLTREIQDSVMAIRAQPVKSVFQRMPRLVREVAAATGKRVRLVTDGEGTEVDKTVIERLSEPITHMIRNAIDHGLETPEARAAAGKAEEGTVRLSALHRSGRIVIEVADDGRGIDRERVRAIAIKRGVIEADAVLTDDEIDNLIFAPGFSTAEAVSDISGRGVGMDVVKRSIQALGGRIVIASRPGEGSTFTLSLPLTLAVLDGMVVSTQDQTLVVPISVIVETLKPRAVDIRPLGPDGAVLKVRDTHAPIIDVGAALGWAPSGDDLLGGVMMLVEGEMGGLVALRVDAIQGQRQVVIKSLEQNYRNVPGVAAATILGDGRVALILDVDGLVADRRIGGARPLPLALAS